MRGLTGRRREIIRLVAEGGGNREIAARLVVTVNTVRAHLNHIYNALGASSRMILAAKAARGELAEMTEGEHSECRPEETPPQDRHT